MDIQQIKKRWYVYFLCDPDTEKPFYVGKGSGNRIDQHEQEINDSAAHNPAKQEVICRILAQGKRVLKKKIAEFDNEHDAYVLERGLIKHYGSQLTNIRPGGGGLQIEQRPDFLIPIRQQTIPLHGKPITVVQFADGRTGVVLLYFCRNLHLDAHGQCERIQRTEVIAEDLVYAEIQTNGGAQIMPTLITRSLPYWLATIDTRKMKKGDERREEILNYQRKAMSAFSPWSPPFTKQQSRPMPPPKGATLYEWRDYHLQMVVWIKEREREEKMKGDHLSTNSQI